ncbi:MAG: hypothetical protein CMB53_04980 [Euryarchaeota archaeon]|nr:hypothetical protein [Euryarchaeota archaeon]
MEDAQEAPDLDPALSSGAMNLNPRKLERVPWDHSGRHPGNRPFWTIILWAVDIAWAIIFRRSYIDPTPENEGGAVFASIHINGLVDPLAIVKSQRTPFVSIGRHDIMTMPVIGWMTRRMGSQPVIRRAELRGGVSDPEFAARINQRSMLTMANCIASGHPAVVMPEGKSHQDSKLHALRTGTLRFTLNAASIAHSRGLPMPVIQPVGLHYRCHHWFRTEAYIEFGEPINIPLVDDQLHNSKLVDGVWTEPPAEQVIPLRDELYEKLSAITPNSPDWETYRAWHLLGHLSAIKEGRKLSSYRQEVLAAREIRDSNPPEALLEAAIEAAEILHSANLDATVLDENAKVDRRKPLAKGLVGALLMAVTAPIVVISSGLQTLAGWYQGNNSDEGIDARTTHHMIGAVFSPLLFWPIASLVFTILFSLSNPLTEFAFAFMSILASNFIFLRGYDWWVDFRTSLRCAILARSDSGKRLEELITEIEPTLVVLK